MPQGQKNHIILQPFISRLRPCCIQPPSTRASTWPRRKRLIKKIYKIKKILLVILFSLMKVIITICLLPFSSWIINPYIPFSSFVSSFVASLPSSLVTFPTRTSSIPTTLMFLVQPLEHKLMESGHYDSLITYEARVRFETRVRVRVRVRDSAIFEKSGCGCGRTRRLKNY